MRKYGLDDEGILELMAVVDLFSGYNKLMDGLEVEPEALVLERVGELVGERDLLQEAVGGLRAAHDPQEHLRAGSRHDRRGARRIGSRNWWRCARRDPNRRTLVVRCCAAGVYGSGSRVPIDKMARTFGETPEGLCKEWVEDR